MMQAIDVEITPLEGLHARHIFEWSADNNYDPNVTCDTCGVSRWEYMKQLDTAGVMTSWGMSRTETPPVWLARQYAERIQNTFNHDDSDTMTDYFHVKFYGHVAVS